MLRIINPVLAGDIEAEKVKVVIHPILENLGNIASIESTHESVS